MPQITIEYSINAERSTDMPGLAQVVHVAARDSGLFQKGYGIRTRLAPRSVYVIADGDPQNAFIAIRLRIAEGRSEADRQRLAEEVFAATCTHLRDAMETTPLALSLEVQEIRSLGAMNANNLKQRLAVKYGD